MKQVKKKKKKREATYSSNILKDAEIFYSFRLKTKPTCPSPHKHLHSSQLLAPYHSNEAGGQAMAMSTLSPKVPTATCPLSATLVDLHQNQTSFTPAT